MCLGIPGRITSMREDGALLMGIVDFGGATREVCLSYVESEAGVGDYVIVHAGFAIAAIDEDEARSTLELLSGLSNTVDGL
jgi:hydrogenase expression/formation protein HypC